MAGNQGGVQGVGQGRRMPVQQIVDIGIPIETVYNQFTQFEEWPEFMHRVKRATQDDDCTVSFAVKIWGKTREFTAEIETQRPDQRIKWKTSQGMTHAGVVTFHELASNLTRVIVNFDVDPGGLVEKFARGTRQVKRAARADLHRFVAFIEMAEQETGAWRGVIEDGEVVEEHDPSYDEQRQYSDIEELTDQEDSDEDEDEEGDEDENEEERDDEDADEEQPKAQRSRRQRHSRNGSQADEGDEEPATKRTRNQSRASSAGRASSSRRSSGSRSGSSSSRSRSRGSGSAQASGRRTQSRSSKS